MRLGIIYLLFFLVLLPINVKSQDSHLVKEMEINSIDEWDSFLDRVKNEDRKILIYFSGSDWCSNCHALSKRVLKTDEFKNYVKENLFFVNVDFPQNQTKVSKEKLELNEMLASRYNTEGIFPDLVLLQSDGSKIVEIKGYRGEKTVKIIDELNKYRK